MKENTEKGYEIKKLTQEQMLKEGWTPQAATDDETMLGEMARDYKATGTPGLQVAFVRDAELRGYILYTKHAPVIIG